MIVVSNSSPLIGMAKGEVFDALRTLYRKILIPPQIRIEVVDQGRGRPGATEVQEARNDWIIEVAPSELAARHFPASLHFERYVLALAIEKKADLVLMDDIRACTVAGENGIPFIGTSEILFLLKSRGLVAQIKPVLDRMIEKNFGIPPDVYRDLLERLGESGHENQRN